MESVLDRVRSGVVPMLERVKIMLDHLDIQTVRETDWDTFQS